MVSNPHQRFADMLHAHGQSLTQARSAVFEALVGQEPITMRALVAKLPQIDRASVYRTIALFERLGIVQRLQMGWKYRLELSDVFSAHHHHVTCTNCGMTIPIKEELLEQVVAQLGRTYHFTPTAHQMEIQGLCERCTNIT